MGSCLNLISEGSCEEFRTMLYAHDEKLTIRVCGTSSLIKSSLLRPVSIIFSHVTFMRKVY